jgi:methylglutaconyl-CoA hydratase
MPLTLAHREAGAHLYTNMHATLSPQPEFPNGAVRIFLERGVATVSFSHPKGNSLPASLLGQLADSFDGLAVDREVRVVVLRSEGSGSFCAGASFDELRAIRTEAEGREFFGGFARVILAMRRCPTPILARVQGKVVGGGVGLVAATDYSFALAAASVRLSELAIGIGPFVVGPVIERRVGRASFSAMAFDADWRDAAWAERNGLYTRVLDTEAAMDSVLPAMANRLAEMNPEAVAAIKRITWEGTEHWDTLLPERAALSGRLILSPHARRVVESLGA